MCLKIVLFIFKGNQPMRMILYGVSNLEHEGCVLKDHDCHLHQFKKNRV
jgi:hypothetical protein